MAHAHGARGIDMCARAGVQSIEHASYIDESGIDACLKNSVVLVPTLLVFEDEHERAPAQQRRVECLRKAAAKGVKFGLGSDFVGWPPQITAREFSLMNRRLGLTPLQAIAAGTSVAAKLLRLDHCIGTVSIGKNADLVVVCGNPLQDLSLLETSVLAVFKDGKLVASNIKKSKL